MKHRLTMASCMLLAATALMIGPAMAASAAPSPTRTASAAPAPAKHVYCVVTLAPLAPGQVPSPTNHVASRVTGRACSDQPARVGFQPQGSSAPPGGYLLITVYQYTNYQGSALQFRGTQPCNSSNGGFAIADTRPSDNGAGNWGASSWLASNNCWLTSLYYDYNWGGESYTYPQGVYEAGQIGSGLDNHVWSIYTRY